MRPIVLLFIFIYMVGCKQKPSAKEGAALSFAEFAESFPVVKLPFSISDTTFNKVAETASLSRETFRMFVPDSLLASRFLKDTSYIIKPVGKIASKGKEDYLAVYAQGKQKSGVYLLVFNNKKFSTGMPLIESNKDTALHTASIDHKLSIVINAEWMVNNTLMYNRTIYAYNNVGVFTTVLTETNVPRVVNASTVINPLDTFPAKNKYSGDYLKGKKNLLSLRDGASANEYRFFVHFVTDGENACGGDLKGEMKMASANAGIYNSSGDPCIIDFVFSGSQVKVKEQGSCGNYRGITCFFNDTYTRRKEPKLKSKK